MPQCKQTRVLKKHCAQRTHFSWKRMRSPSPPCLAPGSQPAASCVLEPAPSPQRASQGLELCKGCCFRANASLHTVSLVTLSGPVRQVRGGSLFHLPCPPTDNIVKCCVFFICLFVYMPSALLAPVLPAEDAVPRGQRPVTFSFFRF